jgi:hypothetical protein
MSQRFRLVLRSMYGENAGNRVALRRHDRHHRVMGIVIGPDSAALCQRLESVAGSLYPVYPHDGDQVPSTSYSTG